MDAESLESIRIEGSRAGARGTKRHLDAAVRYAASQQSIAVLQIIDIDDSTRVYELLTIRDEEGWLRVDGLDGTGDVTGLDLAARIGRMGDPARESMLVASIRDRLATKAGGDWSGE